MQAPVERVERELKAAAAKILARLEAEFEILKKTDPARASSFEFGFANGGGKLGPDGTPHPQAPVKFLLNPERTIRKFDLIIPYLRGSSTILELGVGTGFLLKIMRDVHGAEMRGIDVPVAQTYVYGEIRRELGIDHLVAEHVIQPRREIPIPAGTEAIVGYLPVFHAKWQLSDHVWFFDLCRERLTGKKQLVFVYNRAGFVDRPEVFSYYKQWSDFPLATSGNELGDLFCITNL